MKLASATAAMVALLLASCAEEKPVPVDMAESGAETGAEDATDSSAQVIARLFQSSDLNDSGYLSRAEAAAFLNLSLISQDADEDGRLSLEEFQAWDAGFLGLAASNGTADRYEAAKAELFRAWDSNADGYLVFAEYEAGIGRDFAAVPKQDDAHITLEEFANVAFVKLLASAAEQGPEAS